MNLSLLRIQSKKKYFFWGVCVAVSVWGGGGAAVNDFFLL